MKIWSIIGLIIYSLAAFGQPDYVVVNSIEIEGNKKTKASIIIRELDFQLWDTLLLETLSDKWDKNSLRLMNTGLFNDVNFNVDIWTNDNHIDLKILVEEAWYLYPVPIFELADRNFNVWWEDFDHSFSRINYGLSLAHSNFTGRWDNLKAIVQSGFTQKYGIKYFIPYLNKNETLGLNVEVQYKLNRDLHYTNSNNKQVFYRDDSKFIYRRFAADVLFSYRPKLRTRHFFGLFYHNNEVDSYIPEFLNDQFFHDNASQQRYFSLYYSFAIENTDIKPFPTKGNFLSLGLQKNGLGIFDELNALYTVGVYKQYFPFSEKLSMENILMGRIGLIREEQPFHNYRALGFGNSYVRGYELYLLDGLDYFLSQNSIRYEIFNKKFELGRWMPIYAFRSLPLKFYLALNGDFGIANNPYKQVENPLENQLLRGVGVGLNIVAYYDKVFKMEYSWNDIGEHGFFLHFNLGI